MTEQTFEEAIREAGLETCDMLPMTQRSRVIAAIASGVGSMLTAKVIMSNGNQEESAAHTVASVVTGTIAGGCAYVVSGEVETTSDTGAAVLITGVTVATTAVSTIAGKAIGMLLK